MREVRTRTLFLSPRCCRLAVVLTALLVLAAGSGLADQETRGLSLKALHAFEPGERLVYDLAWLSVPAGTAVLEVAEVPAANDGGTYRFLSTAKSNKFVSTFYPVDNRVESIADARSLLPQRMLFRRREGKRKNDFDVTFLRAEGKVRSIKDGTTEIVASPDGVQDALSCLYSLRSAPALLPGISLFMHVHHDRKNYRLELRVEGVETMTAPWGKVETLRILAVMPFQGIFLNEGNVRVWVTNDARRIPVLMRAKVVVGAVTATLVEGTGIPMRR